MHETVALFLLNMLRICEVRTLQCVHYRTPSILTPLMSVVQSCKGLDCCSCGREIQNVEFLTKR